MPKKSFLIEAKDIPKEDNDICLEVTKYCESNNLPLQFVKKEAPVIAIIEGNKYEVTSKFHNGKLLNCWVLSCVEVD